MSHDISSEVYPVPFPGTIQRFRMELTHPNNTDVRSAYLHVAVERSHGVPDLLPDLLEVRIACGIGTDSSDERLQLAALQHARRLLDDTIASLAPRGVDEAIEHHKSPGDQGILSKLESIDMKKPAGLHQGKTTRLSDHITLPASLFIFLVAALTAFAFMVGLELASRVPFWSQGSVALAPSLLILATALYLAGRKATVRSFGS